MQLRVIIDGRLVSRYETRRAGHLYLFHEYGFWSLVALAVTADSRWCDPEGGSGLITLEHFSSVTELAIAMDRHGGAGTWNDLLATDAELNRLATGVSSPQS